MKKIPSALIQTTLPNLNTDILYTLLRREMCGNSCAPTVEGDTIACHECILGNDSAEATKEFRELATKLGVSINILK